MSGGTPNRAQLELGTNSPTLDSYWCKGKRDHGEKGKANQILKFLSLQSTY